MVGNEAVFTERVTVTDLAQEIKEVKEMLRNAGIMARIGTAEIFNVCKGLPTENIFGDEKTPDNGVDMTPVALESDWIDVNTHVYYGGVSPLSGGAGKYVVNGYDDIKAYYGNQCTSPKQVFPRVENHG